MKSENIGLSFIMLVVLYLVGKIVFFDFDGITNHMKLNAKELKIEQKDNKNIKHTNKIDNTKDINNTKSLQSEIITKDKEEKKTKKSKEKRFKKDDNLLIDNETKLMWQDDIASKTITRTIISLENFYNKKYNNTNGNTAQQYCKNLKIDEYDDFRLPTIDELKEILIYGVLNNVSTYNYWSSSLANEKESYYIYTYDLSVGMHFNNYSLYVKCVRDM